MPAALPLLSAAFAAGIVLGAASVLSLWLSVGCGVAAAVVSLGLAQKKKSAAAGLLLLFFFLGAVAQYSAHRAVHTSWAAVIGHEMELSGYVQEAAVVNGDRQLFLLRAQAGRLPGGEWRKLRGTARVLVYAADELTLAYGQKIHLRGTPLQADGRRNPGGFDYAAYLETVGAGAVLSVPGRDVTLLPGSGGPWLLTAAARLRERAVGVILRFLPPREAGLAAGVLLGERQAVLPETRDAYRLTGIAHLLAVSGLHVGYVAAFAMFLGRLLPGGHSGRLSTLTAALLVLAYVMLSGGRPPVWRAALTMLLALGAARAGRERDGLQALSAAALGILFWRPLWLFALSFQFSFLATAGILLLAPRLQKLFFPLPRWLALSLAVTLAAQLAVLPLQAVHFGNISILALPLNLLCVPLVGVAMALGLAGVLAGLASPPLAAPFMWASLPVFSLLERLPRLAAAWPAASLQIPAVPPSWWLAYLFLLGLFAAGVRLRPLTGKHLLTALLLLNFLVLGAWPAGGRGQLNVTFIDVGQGLAVHVHTPCGRNLLYDAGGRPGADTGGAVVLPYLKAQGVRTLDALILSHPHFDHYGGMLSLVRALPVQAFISSGDEEESTDFQTLLQSLAEAGVPRYTVAAGQRLEIGDVLLDVLSPPQERLRHSTDEVNNNSLVLRLTYGDFSLLLTGDAESEALVRIMREQPQACRSVVLQVPHHGSRGALSPDLLERSAAKMAIIPVGRNLFGHPNSETLSLLEGAGIQVYRSDVHGAVRIVSDGSSWSVSVQVAEKRAAGE